MDLVIPITKDKVNKAIIKILSSFNDFSNYEINVLSTMLDQDIKVLDTEGRKKVRDCMGTDQYTLNNYIAKLKSRNALIDNKGNLSINGAILTAINDQKINIAFKIT